MPPARMRQPPQPLIACEDCGKQFKSHYILILHARYHRKESNYIFQRHSAGPQTEEPDAPLAAEEPPAQACSPPAVLGQLSPPHLPNPTVPTSPHAHAPTAGQPDDDDLMMEEEVGDDDDEEYTADEACGAGRVCGVGAGDDEEEAMDAGAGGGSDCEEELECEICDARFHQLLELVKHIRVHRYELTESNYQQYRRKILTTHRPSGVHVDLRRLTEEADGGGGGTENPRSGGGGKSGGAAGASAAAAAAAGSEYECDYCGKRFPTSSNLRRHIPVHTGERPHECPFCGCRFADRSYMLKHARFVHNVELARVQKAKSRARYTTARFKCQICNRYFENADILAMHLDKYHSRPEQSGAGAGSGGLRRQGSNPRHPPHGGFDDEATEEDEYAEEEEEEEDDDGLIIEDAGPGGRHTGTGAAAGADTTETTLFSCDQCDFISADLALLHAHLAEHMEPPPTQLGDSEAADSKPPRLTVTISDG